LIRVVVGGDLDMLSREAQSEVQRVCKRRGIELNFVPQLMGLGWAPPMDRAPEPEGPPAFELPAYFRLKRFIDFSVSLVLLILLLPLFAGVGLLVLLDVGSPVFFWQQRLGEGQRSFLVYKFRTLRAPFDWRGRRVDYSQRMSWIGQLLRETSLDELPQLLNVLVGDMSLIGPRPLLPEDQPSNPAIRLMVRPGVTGWAQVNGAKLLTAEEKDRFDEWYIRNASLWLDFRILILTIQYVSKGPPRPEGIVSNPNEVRGGEVAHWTNFAAAERDVSAL
jgi:lipopolysaccharide/colanic/teichoic acid biosynthesis glycosyltransferase